jgi:hypothetical protein
MNPRTEVPRLQTVDDRLARCRSALAPFSLQLLLGEGTAQSNHSAIALIADDGSIRRGCIDDHCILREL